MLKLDSQAFMIVLGSFFLIMGIAGITGKYQNWYWQSRRAVYAYPPIGLLFLLVALEQGVVDPTWKQLLRIGEIGVFGIVLWWVLRPPKFLQPEWIRRIEQYPVEVYYALRDDVKQGVDWRSRIKDPSSLEHWIKSAEKKVGRSKPSAKR